MTPNTLIERLRGIVRIPVNDGAGLLDGKDFFERSFPTSNLAREAADEIERLTAALEGSVAVPAWQPIETAPKDKYILAICMEWWEPVNGDHRWTYSRIRETNWMVGSERWDFGCEKQPTHWMSRPAFPRQERSTEAGDQRIADAINDGMFRRTPR